MGMLPGSPSPLSAESVSLLAAKLLTSNGAGGQCPLCYVCPLFKTHGVFPLLCFACGGAVAVVRKTFRFYAAPQAAGMSPQVLSHTANPAFHDSHRATPICRKASLCSFSSERP